MLTQSAVPSPTSEATARVPRRLPKRGLAHRRKGSPDSRSVAGPATILRGCHPVLDRQRSRPQDWPEAVALRPLRSQPHARTIAQPQPSSRPLFLRHLQPFASPDALHSILAHRPPRILQQHRNAPVAVAPVLHSQGQDRLCQLIFVRAPQRLIALCPSPLPHHSARPPLTHCILLAGMLHGAPTSLRA